MTSGTLATVGDQSAYSRYELGVSDYASQTNGASPFPVKPKSSREGLDKTKFGSKGAAPTETKSVKKMKQRKSRKGDASNHVDGERAVENKSKRVRTGCLTCRERHLKCDEGMPDCKNCNKSRRTCKRGLKLNFLDIWSGALPQSTCLFGADSWKVQFQDESRSIASEYQGGLEKYPPLGRGKRNDAPAESALSLEIPQSAPPLQCHVPNQPPAPSIGMMPEAYPSHQPEMGNMFDQHPRQATHPYHAHTPQQTGVNPQYSGSGTSTIHPGSVGSYNHSAGELAPRCDVDKKDYVTDPDETLFIQVFVEEVGVWMDSMDVQKHFSRLLPFHALSDPMLYNALLACGARHMTLINPVYSEDKAQQYYDRATEFLFKHLENPNRDGVACAATAAILNVYEIISELPLQRMNHIAGARALIKENRWDARSPGIGQACFWMNVGLEVLSCLRFNWQVAWSPDQWGLDMDLSRDGHPIEEEVWTHQMLYIVARMCNFRATAPRGVNSHQITAHQRYEEWSHLKALADLWNQNVPRTMHPVAYVHPAQTVSKSAFPEVWLIKRTTVVGRLFFHTAQLLLAQTHPYYSPDSSNEMAELQSTHAIMICGISAHVKDRYVLCSNIL